jgi:hypothetical protein
MVGPPFSFTAEGRFFLLPTEETMEATTIAVIVLVTLFLGALAAFVIFMNTEEAPKKKG